MHETVGIPGGGTVSSQAPHAEVAARLGRGQQRYTSGRRTLVELLHGAGRPLEIVELAQGPGKLPVSTIYRNLVVLEQAGAVTRYPGAGVGTPATSCPRSWSATTITWSAAAAAGSRTTPSPRRSTPACPRCWTRSPPAPASPSPTTGWSCAASVSAAADPVMRIIAKSGTMGRADNPADGKGGAMGRRRGGLLAACLVAVLAAGCSGPGGDRDTGGPGLRVVATTTQVADLAANVGGDRRRVYQRAQAERRPPRLRAVTRRHRRHRRRRRGRPERRRPGAVARRHDRERRNRRRRSSTPARA